jgi:bacterioferritin-associated ferredoxin
MIVCSCAYVTDRDLEQAVLEVMSQPNAPLPTPGVIYRHLQKKMQCCGCAPLAAEMIYAKMEELENRGLICPCACATAKTRMKDIMSPPERRVSRTLRDTPRGPPQSANAHRKVAGPTGSSL